MTAKKSTLEAMLLAAGKKMSGKGVAGISLIEAFERVHSTHSDYQKLKQEEKTKRLAILADRDATIEQIRAQRDVIKQALTEAFELRKTGLQAQINAMDKAIDQNNAEALQIVMDSMVKTIQSSPFKDIAEMKEKLSDKDFVLRLK